VQTPKPSPSSFAREAYFGVTAFRFVNQDGVTRHGRYRISPDAGIEHLDAAALQGKDASYLFDELASRVRAGAVQFHVQVQIAGEGDIVDDATVHWPGDRPSIDFGSVVLTAQAPDNELQQQRIIFDPIPRVDGIEPSDDPLLELRAAIYLMSGRRRRQAGEPQSGLSTAG
jgi:catalase